MEKIEVYIAQFNEMVFQYAPKVVLALVTLFVGFKVINGLSGAVRKHLTKSGVDVTIAAYVQGITRVLIKIALFITVASILGVQTTSFVAILGAAGLAIGLALKDSLGNFAGGVMLLVFRPFKVGDFVEAQGQAGSITAIKTFVTTMTTGDNKVVTVPNGPLATGTITNYSALPTRRVDMEFGVGYDDDLDKVKVVLNKLMNQDQRILKDPTPFLAVKTLADSSVNFVMRVWVKTPDYWGVFFDMQENVKKEFDKEGISIPFPQRDVNLYQKSA